MSRKDGSGTPRRRQDGRPGARPHDKFVIEISCSASRTEWMKFFLIPRVAISLKRGAVFPWLPSIDLRSCARGNGMWVTSLDYFNCLSSGSVPAFPAWFGCPFRHGCQLLSQRKLNALVTFADFDVERSLVAEFLAPS